MILGDFNAVTGNSRIQCDTALGPWGSGTPNVNTDLLYCHSAGGTISALQDLGSRERIFTASLGFTTMGKLGRRLITYLRLAAKWFDSAEFVAVSTLTLTIFLCWRLWSLSLRDRLSLKPSTASQTCHLFLILTWVGSMQRMFPQNLKPPHWRIRPLKPCWVITKVLSILRVCIRNRELHARNDDALFSGPG